MTLYDKDGNKIDLVEKNDVNEYTLLAGTGLSFLYNEVIAIIDINVSISSMTGGNVSNNGIIKLPENVVPRKMLYGMSSLMTQYWEPNNVCCYIGFKTNSADITLRTNVDQSNIVLVDSLVFPVSFFSIS